MKNNAVVALVFLCLLASGILFLFTRRGVEYTPVASPVAAMVLEASPLPPSMTPSPTLIPSPTVDYLATAQIAQATADEARRMNALATVEYLRLMQSQLNLTAAADVRTQEVAGWTVTAALTSIPLTATQQAANNTLVPFQQGVLAGQMTATAEAPTQIVAVERARVTARYAEMNEKVGLFAKGALGLFCLSMAVFLARYPIRKSEQPVEAGQAVAEPEARPSSILIQRETGNGAYLDREYLPEVPCTPEQLTEFASEITQGRKTMRINLWEGKGTLWNRDSYLPFRHWARQCGFAVEAGNGQLSPTNEFLNFLMYWLDHQEMKPGYRFNIQQGAPNA